MSGIFIEKAVFLQRNIVNHGHLGQKETIRRHGENPQQGHEAGTHRAPLPLESGLPLPEECARAAGHAGHRAQEVRGGDIRAWVFLAWA